MRVDIHITAGPAKGQQFTFERPDRFLFGRSVDARVSLPHDPYVSRRHFLLEISPPECKITDLESKNGTIVNGIRYGGKKSAAQGIMQAPNDIKEVFLKDRDEITVGDSVMEISIQDKEPVSENPQSDEATLSCLPAVIPAGKPAKHVELLNKMLHEAAVEKSVPDAPDIAGYRIKRLIDRGGMGIVFEAIELTTGRTVAIKTMIPHMAADPGNIHAFQREIEVTQQLKHQNIVQLFEHGKTEETFYFVLEFVDGMNLHQLLEERKSPIPLKEAIPIMLGTLDGLAYAHHAKVIMEIAPGEKSEFIGIVHRDVKPQNILLSRSDGAWIAKISDFGISKSFESAGFTNITKPGDVLGTPMYWPREQITHYRYLNPATDVFSVAAVFYELLTGKWVREGFTALFDRCRLNKRLASISDYMNVIIKNPAIPIRRRNPDIPESVARVIDQALQEDEVSYDEQEMRKALSRLRYPDAQAFREALFHALCEEEGLVAPEEQQRASAAALAGDARANEEPLEKKGTPEEHNASERAWPTSLEIPVHEQGGSIFYSIIHQTARKEVALVVLDLKGSSEYLREVGDTYFSNIIGGTYKRVKNHDSALDLMFLKSTGDGFLAVFSTVASAFSLALYFLRHPIHPNIQIRIALHWGQVKSGPGGDVLGVEVHRVFRMENVQEKDQIDPPGHSIAFPVSNRIIATKPILEHLSPQERQQFQYAGKFMLKGFDDLYELWFFQEK